MNLYNFIRSGNMRQIKNTNEGPPLVGREQIVQNVQCIL